MCGDFEMEFDSNIHHSDGAWAACDVCKGLVESNDRYGLLNRSVERFFEIHKEDIVDTTDLRASIWRQVKLWQTGFWDHKVASPALPVV
jgi:hypothetical protein